jgi:hypothetical protein
MMEQDGLVPIISRSLTVILSVFLCVLCDSVVNQGTTSVSPGLSRMFCSSFSPDVYSL